MMMLSGVVISRSRFVFAALDFIPKACVVIAAGLFVAGVLSMPYYAVVIPPVPYFVLSTYLNDVLLFGLGAFFAVFAVFAEVLSRRAAKSEASLPS